MSQGGGEYPASTPAPSADNRAWVRYLFVFAIFFLVSGFFAYHSYHRSAYSQQSLYWPSVEGVVVSHAVRASHGGHDSPGQQEVVGDTYVVDGEPYSSDLVFWQHEALICDVCQRAACEHRLLKPYSQRISQTNGISELCAIRLIELLAHGLGGTA